MKVQNIFTLLLMGCMSVGLNANYEYSFEEATSFAKQYLKRVSFGEELAGEKFVSEHTGFISYQNALGKIENLQRQGPGYWEDASSWLITMLAGAVRTSCNRTNFEECIMAKAKYCIKHIYNYCTNPGNAVRTKA